MEGARACDFQARTSSSSCARRLVAEEGQSVGEEKQVNLQTYVLLILGRGIFVHIRDDLGAKGDLGNACEILHLECDLGVPVYEPLK